MRGEGRGGERGDEGKGVERGEERMKGGEDRRRAEGFLTLVVKDLITL